MRIFLDSVGCRLNQAEIEEMAAKFRAAGHEVVPTAGEADLAVINTCTVTSQAASDSRKKTRQAERKGVGEIILTGCWSTVEPEKAASLKKVSQLVPNARKDQLVSELIVGLVPIFDQEPLARQPLPGIRKRTRAFIKVQDGCDNRCTFCITTIARGKGNSREIPEIVQNIQLASQGGTREVVLTGVHLGSWGNDRPEKSENLADLIKAILNNTEIPRLRISSLEPWDIPPVFFELWHDKRMCPHLHFPLQSGSEATLKRMARKVTPASFKQLMEQARETIPGVAITTDLIAGFPGETEQEFNESIDFVQQMRFSGGHVFTYSPRPGTAAASMPEQVPFQIRKSRNAILRDILKDSQRKYADQFIEREMEVLWETSDQQPDGSWQLGGLAQNYLHVYSESSGSRWNHIDRVLIKKTGGSSLVGDIVMQK